MMIGSSSSPSGRRRRAAGIVGGIELLRHMNRGYVSQLRQDFFWYSFPPKIFDVRKVSARIVSKHSSPLKAAIIFFFCPFFASGKVGVIDWSFFYFSRVLIFRTRGFNYCRHEFPFHPLFFFQFLYRGDFPPHKILDFRRCR